VTLDVAIQDYARYGVQSLEDKQKLFRLIKTISSGAELSEPSTPPGYLRPAHTSGMETLLSSEFRGDLGSGIMDLHSIDDSMLFSEVRSVIDFSNFYVSCPGPLSFLTFCIPDAIFGTFSSPSHLWRVFIDFYEQRGSELTFVLKVHAVVWISHFTKEVRDNLVVNDAPVFGLYMYLW
jgi:hypothetical protein